MTGWDRPSRPNWDSQDGPDDGTQAFSAPDAPAGDSDPWAAPARDFGGTGFGGADSAGSNFTGPEFSGPPPEFFPEQFEQRTPGATLGRSAPTPSWDLPVRDTASRSRSGAPAWDQAPSGDQGPSWDQAPAWDEPHWTDAARQEFGRQDERDGHDLTRQDLTRQDLGGQDLGRLDFGGQDLPRRSQSRPNLDWSDPGRGDFGAQNGYGGLEPPRQDLGRPDFGGQDFGTQGLAGQGFGLQDPADLDFSRREPGRGYRDGQPDYDAQPGRPGQPGYAGEQGQPEQEIPASVRLEQERAARMDPALQDFFGPAAPGSGYRPSNRQAQGERPPARPVDPWDEPAGYQPPAPPRGPDGPGPRGGSGAVGLPSPRGGSGPGRALDSRPRKSSGGRASRILAVTAVVVVVAAAGAYLALHKTNNSSSANGAIPTVGASTPAAVTPSASAKPKATAKSHVTGNAATDGYVLSAPSVAGGYPLGSDPQFLATATTTATAIEQSAISHSGGTVTGKPVTASYTLPAEQTIEFVGYQGTFSPKTVMANLADFGTSEATYSPGPHGGKMACANVPATATAGSGGVCVWVTATTLGVTEFFQSTGPEVLTVAQSKGAADTLALRASVETRKS